MQTHALLLNADYRPIKPITWERAVTLILDEKADLVTAYADQFLRSVHLTLEWPAVIRLRQFVKVKGRVRFKRSNVLARDAYTCQYCGVMPRTQRGKPDLEELTIDHVVPRAQSRRGKVTLPWNKKEVSVTSWENVVAACMGCNFRKADRTPVQAGMRLNTFPKVPTGMDILRMSLTRVKIPEEWKLYLPSDSPWRDYWDVELDKD